MKLKTHPAARPLSPPTNSAMMHLTTNFAPRSSCTVECRSSYTMYVESFTNSRPASLHLGRSSPLPPRGHGLLSTLPSPAARTIRLHPLRRLASPSPSLLALVTRSGIFHECSDDLVTRHCEHCERPKRVGQQSRGSDMRIRIPPVTRRAAGEESKVAEMNCQATR